MKQRDDCLPRKLASTSGLSAKGFDSRIHERRVTIFLSASEDGFDDKISASFSSFVDRPVLSVLDVLVLIVFAAVGKISHTSSISTVEDLQSIMLTAAPFIVSWFATSPFTGIYNKIESNDNVKILIRNSIFQTVKGWIIAIPIGCALRGVIKGYTPPVAFVIVTMFATLLLIGVTRVTFTILDNKSVLVENQ